jgi:hypothetical protein
MYENKVVVKIEGLSQKWNRNCKYDIKRNILICVLLIGVMADTCQE